MYVYNISLRMSPEIADDWKAWMLNHHIPAVMNSGCFQSYKMHQLILPEAEEDVTYVMQYHLNELLDYKSYVNNFAPALQQEFRDKYGERVLAFRTLMKVVN